MTLSEVKTFYMLSQCGILIIILSTQSQCSEELQMSFWCQKIRFCGIQMEKWFLARCCTFSPLGGQKNVFSRFWPSCHYVSIFFAENLQSNRSYAAYSPSRICVRFISYRFSAMWRWRLKKLIYILGSPVTTNYYFWLKFCTDFLYIRVASLKFFLIFSMFFVFLFRKTGFRLKNRFLSFHPIRPNKKTKMVYMSSRFQKYHFFTFDLQMTLPEVKTFSMFFWSPWRCDWLFLAQI